MDAFTENTPVTEAAASKTNWRWGKQTRTGHILQRKAWYIYTYGCR